MEKFLPQIKQIKLKLRKAKSVDQDLKVFGASSHKYLVSPPLNRSEIEAFESKYNISLPESFKIFLLNIGNGGISFANSAAGPFYGIYPLGHKVNISYNVNDDPKESLTRPVLIHPQITNQEWEALIEQNNSNQGKIYSGILPIGTQGCTYIHGLILNGTHRGKVVNLDIDLQMPIFTFEDNFLDWYERWLDEILTGELLKDDPTWFGYNERKANPIILDEKEENIDNQIRNKRR